MKCEQVQARLSEYLDNVLDPESRRGVETHLSSCPLCRDEAEALAHSARLVKSLPSVEPPPGFSQKVMAHIREEAERPSFWRRLFLPIRIKVPLHAMALLLIGVLGIYLFQTSPPLRTEGVQSLPPQATPSSPQESYVSGPPAAAPPETAKEKSRDVGRKVIPSLESPERREMATPAPRVAEPQAKSKEAAPARAGRTLSRSAEESPTLGERLQAEVSPSADYVLTFEPQESFAGREGLRKKLDDLVTRVGGEYVPPNLPHASQTLSITLPPEQYNRFTRELASLGRITSESRLLASPAPTVLRIRLTILPPQQPETSRPTP